MTLCRSFILSPNFKSNIRNGLVKCLKKSNSVEMNVYIEFVCLLFFFFALFNNLTFKECDAAKDCSINSDEGEGFFFAITIRAAK